MVADGFYEWAKVGPKEKQPYFITTKGRAPFAFAGLWEWWRALEEFRHGRSRRINVHSQACLAHSRRRGYLKSAPGASDMLNWEIAEQQRP